MDSFTIGDPGTKAVKRMIETARLKLVPATVAIARAEIGNRAEFAGLLGASVPDNWPPESAADALPLFLQWIEAAPDQVGWFAWYAVTPLDGSSVPVLVASGGFKGPPRDGEAEIGYSVLPQFQRQGYATEMVHGLVRWAMGQPGVVRIVAETEWANPASVRVLSKLGFAEVGPSSEPGGMRFSLGHIQDRRVEPDPTADLPGE
jgi:ribosomal-protein-alanine N-acetyltransferase